MSAIIDKIYLASAHGSRQREVNIARLTKGVGLEGDRYSRNGEGAGDGMISLIEAEAIAQFNIATGLSVTAADSGRNIVTRGVRLNDLVGKHFRLGAVLLEGFELCEPCATLGKRLATDAVVAADVVAAFTHCAGVRAYVRGSGEIVPGSDISTGS
jgi:MOSC domain-containing protein YiiM